MSCSVTNMGASLVKLLVPDRNWNIDDVVLGFDSAEEFLTNSGHLGATCGRVGGRIAKGNFSLDGQNYQLAINNHENHLHGFPESWSKLLWDLVSINPTSTSENPEAYVKFERVSEDNESGYPGQVKTSVKYILTDQSELRIIMRAYQATKPTIVNMCNHTYWNLGGHQHGKTVLDHKVQLNCSNYTATYPDLIPTGEIKSVDGTGMDLRTPQVLSKAIESLKAKNEDIWSFNNQGYDNNFVIDRSGCGKVVECAKIEDSKSGRVMSLSTNMPGVVFYTANFLQECEGKDKAKYGKFSGLCLETQYFPDSINHKGKPGWENSDCELMPNEEYVNIMNFKFTNN